MAIAIYDRARSGRRVEGRKRTQDALSESEARFAAMADGTPILIWSTDAKSGIRFVNRAYCEFLGTTEKAIEESGWQPLVHPEGAPAYVGAFMTAHTPVPSPGINSPATPDVRPRGRAHLHRTPRRPSKPAANRT